MSEKMIKASIPLDNNDNLLTPRERQVLRFLGVGLQRAEIRKRLSITGVNLRVIIWGLRKKARNV